MKDPVYILGHKNPDADAICSAIAYESLKHALGKTEYVAARCGNSNARVDAILDRFKVPLPLFLGDVTPRVEGIMRREMHTVTRRTTCAEALELIDVHDVRALPVIDEYRHVDGVLSFFQLGEFFVPKPGDPLAMRHVRTTIESIVRSLKAEVLSSYEPDRLEDMYVRVGAMDIRSFGRMSPEQRIEENQSIVVVGDRWDIQERSIQLGVRLLVISGGLEVDHEVVERARENKINLIVSQFDTATTSLIIRTATFVDSLVTKNFLCFDPEDSIAATRRRVADSQDPLFMVLNDSKELIGVFSKSDILQPTRTQIALVDHNELSQAVKGADRVKITEVIDHHRLGNIPTEQPILFINRPVGSTCTIVADLFRNHGITPSPGIAGIMMSGIISDTLNLNSPTATDVDRDILDWLTGLSGVDAEELATLIFTSGSVVISSSPAEVIDSDCKIYEAGEIRYSVSQVEELGFDNFWDKVDSLVEALEEVRKKSDLFFSVLLVTDINSQNSLLVVAGTEEFISQINYRPQHLDNIFDLPGIVSRKKQLIPYLTTVLRQMGVVGEK